jgi:hypothetical protein
MNRDAFIAEEERLVGQADVNRELQRPIGDEEREQVLSLVRWFTRRYATAEERLAYVRRAHSRWTRQWRRRPR